MKAITIHQPWAWLIVNGHKRTENRPRATHHRGALVIHAGKSRDTVNQLLSDGTYTKLQQRYGLPDPKRLDYGAAIGAVTVTHSRTLDEHRQAHPADPFATGPHCYRMADSQRWAKPHHCPGQLGFWNYDADVVEPSREAPSLPLFA